jgi:hypothetical protein
MKQITSKIYQISLGVVNASYLILKQNTYINITNQISPVIVYSL